MSITIKTARSKGGGDRLYVQAPYHPDFPPAARDLGGKWDPGSTQWSFDMRDEQRVRALCWRLYGTDGSAPAEVCTLTVRLGGRLGAGRTLWLCDREVVWRPGRDARVRLGEGVILAAGGFPSSSGSARHPDLSPQAGTVLELRDVPVTLALAAVAQYPDAVSIGVYNEEETHAP